MKTAVYARKLEKANIDYIKELFHYLKEYDFHITVFRDFYDFLINENNYKPPVEGIYTGYSDIEKDTDFVISIGGDGTFLDTLSLVRDTDIPVIGINSGKLGFLANISKEDISEAVKALCEKKFTIEKRSLIKVETEKGIFSDFDYALNDMTIQKKGSQMITIHSYLDGEFLNTYWSDGLIIATPTGSTAYSLSAGGPILLPNTSNFIISPISPHNLTIRPIVVPDECEITLKPEGRCSKYLVSLDHRTKVIDKTMILRIKKADFYMSVLRLENSNFYGTLRTKLMWGMDRRN
jgi:NAD+ kinase